MGVLALAAVTPACSDEPTLTVMVTTGLVPGPEFAFVQTQVFDARPAADGSEAIASTVPLQTRYGDEYARGRQVASFGGIAPGEVVVVVRLLRPNGTLLISRRTRITFADNFVLNVHLTRDCVAVTCPAPGGSPEFTECLAGECVDPRCTNTAREFCPEALFCNSDESCSADASCATSNCIDGICEEEEIRGSCDATSYCDPDTGCVALPTSTLDGGAMDGNVLDGDVVDGGDASTDAALDAPIDADIDAAIVCDTVCIDAADPCYIGVWDCAGETPVCSRTWLRRAGLSCGTDRVCNAYGSCVDCANGAACLFDCVDGIVSCDTGEVVCTPSDPVTTAPAGTMCTPGGTCGGGAPCLANFICASEGYCTACVEGEACSVGCSTGTRNCALGGVCELDGGTLAAGTICDAGDGLESHCTAGGACVNCTEGGACDPGVSCHSGTLDCSLGTPDCDDLGLAPPGTACPSGVCSGAGTCFTAFSATHIAAGAEHSCAVRSSDLATLCWGSNDRGELGNGTIGDLPVGTKALFQTISNSLYVRAGEHATIAYGDYTPPMMSTTEDRTVGAGANESGQLADRTFVDAVTPTLSDVHTVKPLAYGLGVDFGCEIDETNGVWCWGNTDHTGQGVGGGFTPTPGVLVLPGAPTIDLAVGARHACSIQTGSGQRRVACWGEGESGQLGDATFTSVAINAVQVFSVNDAMDITAGASHTCALRFITDAGPSSPRDVWCWGRGTEGQLGNSDTMTSNIPRQVALGFSDISAIEAGGDHTCLIRRVSGEVWCWGRGSEGQLGTGSADAAGLPAQVPGVANAVQLAIGRRHSCARLATGNVVCWGDNNRGQLGDGTTTRRLSPVLVRAN